MRPIAIAANRKASGTARPTSPAGTTPLSAIAAVGAMIPTEIAIASKKRSSRRSFPRGWLGGRAQSPRWSSLTSLKIDSGSQQPTTQFGASTTSWMRRSQATLASA